MKKLAIIGTSNSIIKNGYGQLLKQQLPGQIDLLGLGGCSSLNAVFSMLTYDILDNYEYVLFDFCLNDFNFSVARNTHPYIILSYWVFILSKMRKSTTTPIFLLLPQFDAAHPQNASMINLYKKISFLFNVNFIDISQLFYNIPKENLFNEGDVVHLRPEYQKDVAKIILDHLAKPSKKIRMAPCRKDIQFYLYIPPSDGNIKIITTHLREMACYQLNTTTQHDITFKDKNAFIIGMLYWCDGNEGSQFGNAYIYNDKIMLKKNFNLFEKGFFAREIASSIPEGIKNPTLSFRHHTSSLYEITRFETEIVHERLNHILYVNSFLFSNVSPFVYGERFYQRYRSIFEANTERVHASGPLKLLRRLPLLKRCNFFR